LLTLRKRSDIPREYTWDLESIFSTNEDWEQTFQSLLHRIPELEALQGTLAQSGQALLNVLRKRDEVFEKLEGLFVYASMRKDEDTTNSKYQGMFDRAMQLLAQRGLPTRPQAGAVPPSDVNTSGEAARRSDTGRQPEKQK